MDIAYSPMARGFVYLVAMLDWFSRKVLAWRLSTTLETAPCIEALKEAMLRHGKPDIMNIDLCTCDGSVSLIKRIIQLTLVARTICPQYSHLTIKRCGSASLTHNTKSALADVSVETGPKWREKLGLIQNAILRSNRQNHI